MATKNELVIMDEMTLQGVAQGLTCRACTETMTLVNEYLKTGDPAPFSDKEVQTNVYDLFVLADTMERIAKGIKDGIGKLALDTSVTREEDGKMVQASSLYGIKVKDTGCTTKIVDAYNLICRLANDDGANVEAMLKVCDISLKNLAKASGRTEEYLRDAYPDHVQVTKKKNAVIREF